MRGVVFLGERRLELREFPDPTPGPGEVVLAIKASGMCGSDLHTYRAKGGTAAIGIRGRTEPVIAGHEPCGVVAAVGPGVSEAQARVGQRVMNHHYAGCGVCKHCRTGWSQMCLEGSIVYGANGHGGHAPYMKAPAYTVVPLPDELSFEAGAAISCGTGTAFGALTPPEPGGSRYHRHLWPGSRRPQCDDACQGDGRARHHGRTSALSAWGFPSHSARTSPSTRRPLIPLRRSKT